jgi:hypothetical protein
MRLSDKQLKEWLENYWDDLARAAYRAYKIGGRGAIAIDLCDADFTDPALTLEIAYIFEDHLLGPDFTLTDEIVREITGYDPEREILVVLKLARTRVMVKRLEPTDGRPTPKELYNRAADSPAEIGEFPH